MSTLHAVYGKTLEEASGVTWKVLIDKTEAEAYDKIKMIAQEKGVNSNGVLYRWLTNVIGLGLAEQARRLIHPPPREEGEGFGRASGDVAR